MTEGIKALDEEEETGGDVFAISKAGLSPR
jgi:hypothetical protein